MAEATNGASLADYYVQPKPKRGRPKGSKNKSKDGVAPVRGHTDSALVTNPGRVTRSSQREQGQSLDGFTVSRKQRTAETADVMNEQPDDNFWSQLPPIEAGEEMSPLTSLTNEFTTINERVETPDLQPELPEIDPSSPEFRSLMLRLKYAKPTAQTLDPTLEQALRSSPIFIASDPHRPTDNPRHDEDFDESSSSEDNDNEQETGPSPTGVCLFVSKKIDPRTWSCQQVTTDYQIPKVRRAHQGRDWTDLFIHNIYNRLGSGTFDVLREELAKRPFGEHIVLGDMDVHNPAWGGLGTQIHQEAEDLLLIMHEQGLQLTTEERIETWSSRDQSLVIDLTFISSSLYSTLVRCERADDLEHASDHFPIRTELDIGTPLSEPPKRRNWNATDDKKLVEFIEDH
ncbi:hypothetical protein N7474_006221 [Penicillium riverlandense]|uniref:uncharacterized protein n=1 Tax=Penicillium riverlandense TaxID=1903569 RepID=UPI00254685BA|nr:uncharacterized protein N7474_006221 [Penicillium riverlandense]KAJ5820630.1 hypothetical protein N7474_006221 [Penicillium riverlandense]